MRQKKQQKRKKKTEPATQSDVVEKPAEQPVARILS